MASVVVGKVVRVLVVVAVPVVSTALVSSLVVPVV